MMKQNSTIGMLKAQRIVYIVLLSFLATVLLLLRFQRHVSLNHADFTPRISKENDSPRSRQLLPLDDGRRNAQFTVASDKKHRKSKRNKDRTLQPKDSSTRGQSTLQYGMNKYPPLTDSSISSQPKTNFDKQRYLQLIDSDALTADARLIVESVIDFHYNPLKSSPVVPPCKGDLRKNEVEDILCIPRPTYVEGVRNPCWWDKGKKLRCLPYFHLLGIMKCGTSDLWARLKSHPHIIQNSGIKSKEVNWWAWGRYGIFNYDRAAINTFQYYTDQFQQFTDLVQASLQKGEHPIKIITGDGSPDEFNDFRAWPKIAQNRDLQEPWVLTPHLMKHFYPDTKFIIIYRHPYRKLLSDYYYIRHYGKFKNSSGFDHRVKASIKMLADCLRERGVKGCFFNHTMYLTLPLRMHFFFYSVFASEWLKHFPRKNFLFLKTEDYNKDISGTLQKCFQFLDLEPVSDVEMKKISSQNRKEVQKKYPDDIPETKRLLDAMASPVMRLFEDIIEEGT